MGQRRPGDKRFYLASAQKLRLLHVSRHHHAAIPGTPSLSVEIQEVGALQVAKKHRADSQRSFP